MVRDIPTMRRNREAVEIAKYLQNPSEISTGIILKKLRSKTV
jgi:hypothetical protein